jgi:hypothetical protein
VEKKSDIGLFVRFLESFHGIKCQYKDTLVTGENYPDFLVYDVELSFVTQGSWSKFFALYQDHIIDVTNPYLVGFMLCHTATDHDLTRVNSRGFGAGVTIN